MEKTIPCIPSAVNSYKVAQNNVRKGRPSAPYRPPRHPFENHQLQLGKVQKQAVVASGDEGVRMLFELARRDNTRQIVKHVGDPTFRIIVEFQ